MRAIGLLAVVVLLLAPVACGPRATPTAAPVEGTSVPTVTQPEPTPMPTTAPAEPTATTPAPTEPAQVPVQVYFTDRNRFQDGTAPFEVAVERLVPATANLPEAVLQEYFKGPTEAEQAQGLEAITSGFTGFSSLEVKDGIARLYLTGPCTSHGAAYTVAGPLMTNLLQFEEIRAVKIYDAEGVTEEPEGETNSIPPCLEP